VETERFWLMWEQGNGKNQSRGGALSCCISWEFWSRRKKQFKDFNGECKISSFGLMLGWESHNRFILPSKLLPFGIWGMRGFLSHLRSFCFTNLNWTFHQDRLHRHLEYRLSIGINCTYSTLSYNDFAAMRSVQVSTSWRMSLSRSGLLVWRSPSGHIWEMSIAIHLGKINTALPRHQPKMPGNCPNATSIVCLHLCRLQRLAFTE